MKDEVANQVTNTAMQAAVSKAPYVGATAAMIGGYTLNEWLAIVGILFTVLTFFLNWYMQVQRLSVLREANNVQDGRSPASPTSKTDR